MTPFTTLRDAALRLGFWFPWLKSFDLFLYGIRSDAPRTSDRFDDRIGIAYLDALGRPRVEEWPATTDPGASALEAPSNPHGTATLCPGQLHQVWELGVHHPGTPGAYPCLVPVPGAIMPVWRGEDREHVWLDAAGIQLHHAGAASTRVGRWSEGCQVLQRAQDLARVLELVRAQERAGLGHVVSYTLFTADQIR